MKNHTPAITVGITAHSSGESLLYAVRSIRASKGVGISSFVVVSDGDPLPVSVEKGVKAQNVRVIRNSTPGSQMKKIKQIVGMVDTDIYVFTQDDVLFEKDTLAKIRDAFVDDPGLTMVSVNILPLPGKSSFEKIMRVGIKIHNRIARKWNHSDNYLAASGRCLAFKVSHVKKFRFPEEIVNGDAFLYAENKRLGGAFRLVRDAGIHIRCPQTLKEQMRPSKRFQYSEHELKSYFNQDLTSMYTIPKRVLFTAFLQQFDKTPMLTALYCGVYLYTKFAKPYFDVRATVWDTERTTKVIQ